MTNVLINAPKTAKRGEVIELKTLILHPMETGFRAGTNGNLIPRNIIERFTATWNGTEIFRIDLSPAISANPFVSFYMRVPGPGELELTWTEDGGETAVERAKLEIV